MNADLQKAIDESKFYTSDSREIEKGSIFIALVGENSDGHDYIETAFEKGASWAVVSKIPKDTSNREKLILVEDIRAAHVALAKGFRKKFALKVVGVAGSNGKTSTKEFLAQIVSDHVQVFWTQASQNGELGIPKTFEQAREHHDWAIIEIGIDRPGDMDRYLQWADPDFSVLTSIGMEHLENFKSVNVVFSEERKICDWVEKKNGQSFVPGADPYLKKLATELSSCTALDIEGSAFRQTIENRFEEGFLQNNLLLSANMAKVMGVNSDIVVQSISKVELPQGRGSIRELNNGSWIMEDHYNANPSSMSEAIAKVEKFASSHSKSIVFILGDMAELGDVSLPAHEEVLERVRMTSPDEQIYLVGSEFKKVIEQLKLESSEIQHFPESSTVVLNEHKNVVYLVKGSRSMALEAVYKKITV